MVEFNLNCISIGVKKHIAADTVNKCFICDVIPSPFVAYAMVFTFFLFLGLSVAKRIASIWTFKICNWIKNATAIFFFDRNYLYLCNCVISSWLHTQNRCWLHLTRYRCKLEIVDQWSTRIPYPIGEGSNGQCVDCNWTLFKITRQPFESDIAENN